MLREEEGYLQLLQDVQANGVTKTIFSSNGKTLGTIDKNVYSEVSVESKCLYSVAGRTIRFDLSDGKIPLYKSKAVHYRGAFQEMLWMLNDKGDVAKLHRDRKVPIWNGWAYKDYLKLTEEAQPLSYADFVKHYLEPKDAQYTIPIPYTDMTGWEVYDALGNLHVIDQTRWLIDSVKKSPDRKSYKVSAWNPARLYGMAKVGQESVVIAACHDNHQVLIQDGKLVLILSIRSNDLPLGHPFNVCQYGLLAHMYAHCTGYPAGELVVNIGDAHTYSDQIDGISDQLRAEYSNVQPRLTIKDRGQKYLTEFVYEDFTVHDYFPESAIRMPLTIVGGF